MPDLIEVRFKGNRKAFFSWDGKPVPRLGEAVLVEVERGHDVGRVSAVGDTAARKCGIGCAGCAVGAPNEPAGRALRAATDDETHLTAELRKAEEDVRRTVIEKARGHGLAMKISDAEWQFDRKKLTVYFTAEKRVDFRALVRDLAALFRTRIELRQIGARDEAKRLDGVGRCGRGYCCSSWLPELRPVSLSLAKDQRLSLNPSQISGGCGRLLCCLRYEHEFYVASRKRFPREGRTVVGARGRERVRAVDIFRERLLLEAEDGATRAVTLAELKAEIAAAERGPVERPHPPSGLVTFDEGAAVDVSPQQAVEAVSPSPARPRKRRRRRGRRGRSSGRHGSPDNPTPEEQPPGGDEE